MSFDGRSAERPGVRKLAYAMGTEACFRGGMGLGFEGASKLAHSRALRAGMWAWVERAQASLRTPGRFARGCGLGF